MNRLFMAMILVVAGVVPGLAPATAQTSAQTGPGAEPVIEHIVVIIEQNHTFDSYFGTYPGADGFSSDQSEFDLVPRSEAILDPGSSGMSNGRSAAIDALASGSMTGFGTSQERRGFDATRPFVHETAETAPVPWQLADDYVLFDRYFSSRLGGSLPNTLHLMVGDDLGVSTDAKSSLQVLRQYQGPTLFDLMTEAGRDWKFYVGRLDEIDPDAVINGRSVRPADRDRSRIGAWRESGPSTGPMVWDRSLFRSGR